VHHLYAGTQRIEAGDLHHEIRVTGRDQLGDLGHSFNRMIRSLRELLRVSAEKQRLDQEMAIAANVQARLFPRAMPHSDTLDLAAGICQPARVVSGDYFDYFEIRPGLIAFVVADVCGKGVSAALLMSNLQAHLRSRALSVMNEPRDLRALVSHVNQRMVEASPDSSYVTMFYAEYDEAASVLRYVNAGHNPPLLFTESECKKLEEGGTVVGLFRESVYMVGEVTLVAGDIFVAYTDGLLEARNPAGEEIGEARLAQWLTALRHQSAEAIKQHLLSQVANWTESAEQEDDLTLMVWRKR
jgi:sigma-B regulation protein RsbU (phosphoserine phosphatase)